MRKQALAAIFCIGLVLAPSPAAGADGGWLIRARAVNLNPSASSSPVAGIDVEQRWIPEVDVSYFMTKNLALELILTYPQKHDVTLNGANIGSVRHLPPTLTLQYHFLPEAQFRPYVGAGINYTRFSNVALNVPGVGALGMERSSTGFALQGGLDIALGKNLVLNLDVKKIKMEADLTTGAGFLSRLTIDPLLVGVGLGWRF